MFEGRLVELKEIQEIIDKIKNFRNYYVSATISAFIPFVFGYICLFLMSFLPKTTLYYGLTISSLFAVIGMIVVVIVTNLNLLFDRNLLLKKSKKYNLDVDDIVVVFRDGKFRYNIQNMYVSSLLYDEFSELFKMPKELSVREEQTYFNVADNRLYSIFFISKLIIYIMAKKCAIFVFILLNFVLFTLIMVKFIKILYGII